MSTKSISALLTASTSFTAQDATITGNGARDPMGFEAFWSYLGRQIFDNKITSIANDVRNYTAALLHHAVIRNLQYEGVFSRVKELLQKEEGEKAYSDQYAVVALIIFLENLLTYSMVREDSDEREVKTEGMLGVSKGATAAFEWIWISRRKDAFVLVNQANIGLNARYKTPFYNMKLYDGQYHYEFNGSRYEAIWEEVDDFPEDFIKLRDLLVQLIKNMVGGRGGSLGFYLENSPTLLPEVVEGYQRFFAFPIMSHYDKITSFWKKHLGFNDPPALYLYNSFREVIDEQNGFSGDIPHREVFKRAKENAESANDLKSAYKFQAIIETENFLAPLRYVFDLLLTGKYSNLKDEDLHDRIAYAMKKVRSNALPEIKKYFDKSSVYVQARVERLLDLVAKADTSISFLREILSYHKMITDERKNVPWVREESGRLELLSGSIVPMKKLSVVYDWYHGYYLESLLNIIRGFGEVKYGQNEEYSDVE